jgi:hypothetical protein
MEVDTGALFLLRRTGLVMQDASLESASADDVALARSIVQELGGLPLALDQAGAYIEEVQCGLLDCQQLVPHAQICAVFIKEWCMGSPEALHLLELVGQYLYEYGQYRDSESIVQQLLAHKEEVHANRYCPCTIVHAYVIELCKFPFYHLRQ